MGGRSRVLYCHCTYSDKVPADVKGDVLRALANSRAAFEAVPDLCEMCARRDPALRGLAESDDLRIAACFGRAVRWLFHAGGASWPDGRADVLNMKTGTADEIARALLREPRPDGASPTSEPDGRGLEVVLYEGPDAEPIAPERRLAILRRLLEAGYRVACTAADGRFGADAAGVLVLGRFAGGQAPAALSDAGDGVVCRDLGSASDEDVLRIVEEVRERLSLPKPGRWIPWFPVIDYDRCVSCRQCANFCIFGAFEVDDGTVRVAHPEKCKTDCPACARMCGQLAIIFPKHPTAPINGAEVTEEALHAARHDGDLRTKLQGDVYAVLRSRGGGAGAAGTGSPPSPAELAETLKSLDVPRSVLMSLPVAGAGSDEPPPGSRQRPSPDCCGETPADDPAADTAETERDRRE